MQLGMFTSGSPRFRALSGPRVDLGRGAWIQRVPGWLDGQVALFERLRSATHWASQQRQMYDRVVDVPRLLGAPPDPPEPLLSEARARLEAHTGWSLERISLALYRDGNDSVAWHGDRMGELRSSCVMAILSLGAQRRFLLRPSEGGRSVTLHLNGGDVLVMGGTIHETFEHAVPKESHADPRIAVMFRPSGRPNPT
ncbi:MAG: alpha-ketoglutarate-dependent dioxygenase AlkB [Myxococcota bacterium]